MQEITEITVCRCDRKTPMIFTFKFPGCEYWCPRCGHTSGMFGAGIRVPITPEILQKHEDLKAKATPYL